MALESIWGAALVYLSRQDDAVGARLRQARRTLDGLTEALATFAARGELLRLRAALVQDFLIGILISRTPRGAGVLPTQVGARPELSPDEPQHWPPQEGLYDANGLGSRLGELAQLGFALTYEEVRTFLIALTQAQPPTPSGRQQIGRAARSLSSVVSSLALDLATYERAWRRLFSGDALGAPSMAPLAPPVPVVPTPLATSAPPEVANGGSIGTATSAARADHTHGHGDQAGDSLHVLATPTAPGFMSDLDKSKLNGIAAGATATPLSGSAPTNVAATSSVGSATSVARADHAHGHGDQLGGTLHALATPIAHGFMADVDKAKLNGIAAGATATPLSGAAPPNIAATGGTGSATAAARADHTHGHGNQSGGALHALATVTTPGFLSEVDKAKLDAITPGGNAHLQSIQLCASRSQQLLPGSSFGVDGQVEMLSLNVAPDVCTVAGTLRDFWVEGQASANVSVTITLLRAPSSGGFPSTTPVTLTVPVGQVTASSATTLSVNAGDRISATSNALWNHSGLVLRARLRA